MRGARRPKPISKYDLGSGGAGAGDAGDARRAGRFGFFSRRFATDERGRGGMFGRKTGAARDAGDLVRRAHARGSQAGGLRAWGCAFEAFQALTTAAHSASAAQLNDVPRPRARTTGAAAA